MPGVFDLGRLDQLIKRAEPKAIIVVDTNVFLENPVFHTWKTSVKDPVFLLLDRILQETLTLVDRYKKFSDSGSKKEDVAAKARQFNRAHKAIDQILEEGDLSAGVHLKEVGWFIAIDSPARQRLQPALDELSVLTDTHGPNDAYFLLLTRQCTEDFKGHTVRFVTGDHGLLTVCNWKNVHPYYCRALPDTGLNDWLKQQIDKQSEADWNEDWRVMIQDVKNRSVEVSLTLTSKKFMHNWSCEIPDLKPEGSTHVSMVIPADVILAEGHGTIHMADGAVSFLWRLPFKPMASPNLAKDRLRGESTSPILDVCDEEGIPVVWPSMTEYDFDFLGRENEVPKAVRQGLLDKLSKCENPDSIKEVGLPTFQSPISVLELFINAHDFLDAVKLWEQGVEHPEVPRPKSPDYAGIRDFLSIWFSTHSAEETADFVDMITSCWNIGHTVRTRVELESESTEQD